MSALNLTKLIEELEQTFPELPLKYNVSWSEMTWLGVGGEIAIVAEPTDDISLSDLLKFCHHKKEAVFVIGGGSNIVGMDDFFNGVVIKLAQNDFIRIKAGTHHLTVGTGVRLSDLVTAAARRGFGGIAPLGSIPGTIGGAVRMNAGSRGITIGDYVVDMCGYDMAGNGIAIDSDEVSWNYRSTNIPENVILTGAILKLPHVDKDSELEKISEEKQRRRASDPSGRTAGCVFKNISPTDQAGRLIDEAGLKDWSCGSARISKKHANFIINHKHASKENIVDLMSKMRSSVAERTGFYLCPEVVFANSADLERIESDSPAPKVAVLKGGDSSEREVSLKSGAAISTALRNAGYIVNEIDIKSCKLPDSIMNADVVFPALHGSWGENGDIQKLLEEADKKFVGCNSEVSRLILDKISSKNLMNKEKLPTPKWCIITEPNSTLPDSINFPLVIKAPREGSTVGIFIVKNKSQYDKILPEAFKYDSELLIEEFIKGTEMTVAIVNNEAMPAIEIVTPTGFYDYDAKYLHNNGETKYLCPPATISSDIQEQASQLAMKFYKAANCRDLLRVDFIIDKDENIYIIEGNNIPGFTSDSLVPKSFKQDKGSMEMLCANLVQAALKH
jgi:UDP-N-acetylenolpyruvoylglucosamine reductase